MYIRKGSVLAARDSHPNDSHPTGRVAVLGDRGSHPSGRGSVLAARDSHPTGRGSVLAARSSSVMPIEDIQFSLIWPILRPFHNSSANRIVPDINPLAFIIGTTSQLRIPLRSLKDSFAMTTSGQRGRCPSQARLHSGRVAVLGDRLSSHRGQRGCCPSQRTRIIARESLRNQTFPIPHPACKWHNRI